MSLLRAAPALGALVLLLSCTGNGADEPAQEGPNQFANPGFEDGRDPWFSLKPPDFILSRDVAHSGNGSALLQMRVDAADEQVKVFYLVQEIAPQEFPEVISGSYRVDHWIRGTEKQYLQFAVIVFDAGDLPGGYPNHQLRYILAGIDEEPFAIANAHFVFLGQDEPVLGQWVEFEARVQEDFQRLWGAVPEDYENIRILFEVRYDDKAPAEGPIEADVYSDDLYSGPTP